MRFTGQVKIPDLDFPGVPASVLVDGKQVEIFVESESIGRWSLVDVRAERLVSSAFSLKLSGEEVTFIADQPTEFAYGGVEEMAKVWATHRAMRLPRRLVANSKSRKGTVPSRIPDLRSAIEESMSGTAPTALGSSRPPARKETSGIASLRDNPSSVRRPNDDSGSSSDTATAAERISPVAEPEPMTQPDGDVAPHDDVTESVSAGQEGKHDPVPDAPDTPDAVFADPEPEPTAAPPVSDSVFKDSVPWAKNVEEEAGEAPPAQPAPRTDQDTERQRPENLEPAEGPEESSWGEPEPQEAAAASVPWIAPDATEHVDREMPEEPVPAADVEGPDDVPDYVVDLGALEDRDDGRDDATPAVRPLAPEPDQDDTEEEVEQLAVASARGGLIGAVRSAFVRNRIEHTHEYVEAPGGLGIKRQICTQCGHISIGVE